MLQGFFGFVLGGILVAVLLASEPQLVGDIQSGLHDLRGGARELVSDRDNAGPRASERRYEDRRDNRDSRDSRDRYENDRPPGDGRAGESGGDTP